MTAQTGSSHSPHPSTAPARPGAPDVRPWQIQLFGGLRVRNGERVITRFRTQKTGTLLAYLACYLGRSHPREVLIELLWPEAATPEAGRHNLSLSLSSLRSQLEPPGVPSGTVLLADRLSVELNPAAVSTDVGAFEEALRAAAQVVEQGERAALLARAADRYGGAFLPGYYDEWVTVEQERLTVRFGEAVHQLVVLRERAAGSSAGGDALAATIGHARRALEADALAATIGHARRALEADPLREEAHQDLIRLLLAGGERGAALRQWREMERLLDAEMAQAPGRTSRQLLRQIEGPEEAGPLLPEPAPRSPTAAAPAAVPDALPAGTVTFLLTDIEGSTALWERAQAREGAGGAGFLALLERHHALLREAFRRSGGREIKEAGDSFLVAFPTASDALACAVAAQNALTVEPWAETAGGEPPRVRMALHSGDVQRDAAGDDYHGLPLHRASRMLAAAQGGQILVSEATAGLVRRDLEMGVRLEDLGVYRLRDVEMPERLFQLDYPGMARSTFPPPAAERAITGGSLPLQFTRFFGREKEITEVGELLRNGDIRLLTLTGPGGTGKTRLAIEAAARLLEPYEGSVWFAPLADLPDAERLGDALLDALHLPRSTGADPLEQVLAALASQPSLLILDNFEQIVETGGAEAVQTLMEKVPGLTVLITSRQLLGLPGEREYPVSPLPTPNGTNGGPERMGAYESVRLFVDRAQAVKPDFQVTSQNAPALAELCDRLEGIPLAIELAAARAQVLTPAQMLAQLANRFEFLVSRKRGIVERQRTLRAAVDWSYRLLAPELQRFFAQLSVFRGGWTAEAAEAVTGEPLALDYLAQLRECSLAQTEEVQGRMRFRLLDSLREYAAGRMGGEEQVRAERDHADFFLALAEETGPKLLGPDQAAWLGRLHADHDNLRAAWEWCLAATPSNEAAESRESRESHQRHAVCLRLATALWRFWSVRGHVTEGRNRLQALLDRVPASHPTLGAGALRAAALDGAGALAHDQGDYSAAAARHDESAALWRALGGGPGLATALNNRGNVALDQDDFDGAIGFYEEALSLYRAAGDDLGAAKVSTNLGALAYDQSDWDRAGALLDESIALKRGLGNHYGLAISLDLLGSVEKERGNLERAAAFHEEALALRRDLDHKQGIAMSLMNLGAVRLAQRDVNAADTALRESLALFEELADERGVTECLGYIGQVAGDRGHYETAARLLGAVAAQREVLGMTLTPAAEGMEVRARDAVRVALGEKAFAAAVAKGATMETDAALQCAWEA